MGRVLFFYDLQGPSAAHEVAFPTVTEGLTMAACALYSGIPSASRRAVEYVTDPDVEA